MISLGKRNVNRIWHSSLQYSLQQPVRSYLNEDSLLGNVLESFLKEHGAQEVVGLILGRAEIR